jgi:hypothetical protein
MDEGGVVHGVDPYHVGARRRSADQRAPGRVARLVGEHLPDADARLLIGGDYEQVAGGSVIDQVRAAADGDPRVRLLGLVPDALVADFYASLDVFTLPSVKRVRGVRDRAAVGGAKTGVVPLPPTNNTGTVKFNPVFVSIANSGTIAVAVNVTIFRQGAGPSTSTFTVPPGTRVSVPGSSPTAPGDLAVGITTTAALPAGHVLTAMVEYGTP